jgi:hypothetical protein
MPLHRYDPATEVFHSGGWDGTYSGGGNVTSGIMADGNDYPGAADASWFQSGVYTPNGTPYLVYHGASIAPHSTPAPGDKAILDITVYALAQAAGAAGTISASWILRDSGGNPLVIASGTFTGTNVPQWFQASAPPVAPIYVPEADVTSFLAGLYFDIYQTVPTGGNNHVDTFSMYALVKTGVALEAVIPIRVTGPGEVSEQHIGGTFPAVIF